MRSCAECPKNQPGSANDNTQRKACHWHKRAVAYLADDLGGQPYLVQLGAMSYSDKLGAANANAARGFKQYAQFLVSHGLIPSAVVTRMTFDTSASVPVVRFSVATDADGNAIALSEDGQRRVEELYNSAEVNALLDAEDSDTEPAATTDTPAPTALPSPPVAANGRPAVGANAELMALLTELKKLDPTTHDEGYEWATHAGTDVTEALEWVRDAIAAATPVTPPAPPPTPAVTKPQKPGARSKSTAAAPSAPPPAAGTASVAGMLGLDTDDL